MQPADLQTCNFLVFVYRVTITQYILNHVNRLAFQAKQGGSLQDRSLLLHTDQVLQQGVNGSWKTVGETNLNELCLIICLESLVTAIYLLLLIFFPGS